MRVLHHALLGHAEAMAAIKAALPRSAAVRADLVMNRLLLDPVLLGTYPEEARKLLWLLWPRMRAGDEALLRSARPDFVGVNTYTREKARYAKDVPLFHFWTDVADPPETDFIRDGIQYTDMGYEVYPPSLRQVLERLRDDYGNPPAYVTENGASFADFPEGDRIHDPKRTAYLEGYLAEAALAIGGGCDLRGCFYWSLMDNMEWALGYGKRHGLVHVDFATQKRIVKDSGLRYAQIIAEHRSSTRAAAGNR